MLTILSAYQKALQYAGVWLSKDDVCVQGKIRLVVEKEFSLEQIR